MYVGNNPVNYVDPTGHCGKLVAGGGTLDTGGCDGGGGGPLVVPAVTIASNGWDYWSFGQSLITFLRAPSLSTALWTLVDGASVLIPGQQSVSVITKGAVKEYDIVRYGLKTQGIENHHGVMDVWAQANIPGYVSRAPDAPTIALSKEAHAATQKVFREWSTAMFGRPIGAKIDWTSVSAKDVHELTEKMFDAAKVPQATRLAYYEAFARYVSNLKK